VLKNNQHELVWFVNHRVRSAVEHFGLWPSCRFASEPTHDLFNDEVMDWATMLGEGQ
jgi:hypothetical protein